MCDDLITKLIWGVMSLEQRFKGDLYSSSLEDIIFLKEHDKHRSL